MPFKFNPFTGNFDQTGSGGGGGGAQYIDGEVATYNDLPLDGTAALNSAWLVRTASGVWPVSRKQAGIYIRTATAGSSRDADYTYAGTMPDVFSDSVFLLYDEASTTRTGQFNLGNITAGQNRVLTWPDGNGTIARTSDIPPAFNPASPGTIGGTTPAAATFTNLVANTELQVPSAAAPSPSAGDLYRVSNTLRFRDSANAERTLAVTTDIPAAGIGGSTGATNQAVLRASGTGGSTAQSSELIVDDPVVAFACTGDASTDIITAVGHNFTNNQLVRFQSLTGGAGLFSGGPASSTNYFVRDVSGSTFRISTSSGGSAVNFTTNITAGAVLAVQRNLTLRTRKQAFSMTADAATDVITATGHTFVNGDAVSFYNLTGGANLDEVSRWYVIEAATNTFKVSNSLNGTARDITTSYTGGTVELEIPLVLGAPRSSALILGDKPDGSIVGGNVRGYGAVDLQTNRNGQNAVASGNFSFIGGGQNNTASGTRALILGGTGNTASTTDAVVCGGQDNQATGTWSCVAGGTGNISSNVTAFTACSSNTASADAAAALGGRNANADRANTLAQASGRFGTNNGDAQTIRFSLRNKSSTATAVELQMGFNSGAYTGLWGSRFSIPSGRTMSALINIIAATSGGEFANRYVRAVTIANRNGTTALRGAIKDIDTDAQIAGAAISITADDTNDALRIEFSGVAPVPGCTTSGSGTAAVINKVAHGYSNNDDIVFTSLTGGAGLTANTVTYWVINATADTFQVSATRGGTSVNISTNYTDMTAARLFRVVAGIDAVEVGHGT